MLCGKLLQGFGNYSTKLVSVIIFIVFFLYISPESQVSDTKKLALWWNYNLFVFDTTFLVVFLCQNWKQQVSAKNQHLDISDFVPFI